MTSPAFLGDTLGSSAKIVVENYNVAVSLHDKSTIKLSVRTTLVPGIIKLTLIRFEFQEL